MKTKKKEENPVLRGKTRNGERVRLERLVSDLNKTSADQRGKIKQQADKLKAKNRIFVRGRM